MSYFDLLAWLGRNPVEVLLWAFVLFAGAVVCSVPFVVFQIWRESEIDKAKDAQVRSQVLAAASQLPPPWSQKASKGWKK
jgi:hypothetical protein